jgi:hypothetical protein
MTSRSPLALEEIRSRQEESSIGQMSRKDLVKLYTLLNSFRRYLRAKHPASNRAGEVSLDVLEAIDKFHQEQGR